MFVPATLVALAVPTVAPAQTSQTVTDAPQMFVTVGVGGQLTSTDIGTRETFDLFQETATINTDILIGRGARFEVGGGRWIGERLGVGIRFSVFRKTGELSADYTLPYPFLFNEHRRASTSVDAAQHMRDLHIQALWKLHDSGVWQVTVFGGPTITWLSQDLTNSAVDVTYAFPFDEIVLSPGSGGRPDGRAAGGHAGLTLTRRLATRVALDTEVRWNSATVDLDDDGTTVAVETGGLQAVVGLRFAF
jgi:hypothetical protein